MYHFNVEQATKDCIQWIRDFFEENGKDCNAVVGISGGKDSSVVAALCVEALGKDRVIGVLMPKGEQFDIDYSKDLVEFLDIRNITVNVGEAVEALTRSIEENQPLSRQAQVDSRFIRHPMGPVSLMVTISSKDTMADTIKAAIGPKRNPPMVMTTSLGSYLRKRTMGMRTVHTSA